MNKITKIRPSPTSHAAEQSIGTIKTGNDSSKWIVLPNNSGIKKWTKLVAPIKKYQTHWNGARPNLVVVAANTLIILKNNGDNKFDELVLKIDKYTKLFIGTNTNKFDGYYSEKFIGNSILIEIKPKEYIFIGKDVYKFITETPIIKYYSIMGNSDIPYPFAISQDKIYLMIENMCFDVGHWNKIRDPYLVYYDFEKKLSNIKSTKYVVKYINKYKF